MTTPSAQDTIGVDDSSQRLDASNQLINDPNPLADVSVMPANSSNIPVDESNLLVDSSQLRVDNSNQLIDDPNELFDVEITPSTIFHGSFFIDNAHPKSIVFALLVLIAIIAIHIFMSWRGPKLVASTDEFFQVVLPETNSSIDIDITLFPLQNSYRFLDINCTVHRRIPAPNKIELEVIYSSKAVFLKNSTFMNSASSSPETIKVEFQEGSLDGSPFQVIHKTVEDYDTAQIKLSLILDFYAIDGLQFRSFYVNPSAFVVIRGARVLLSLLLGYMLIVYLSFLSGNSDPFTEVFCLTLGITGIISANPIPLFWNSDGSMTLSDYVFLSAFVALFRMFCFLQMELIRSRKTTLNLLFLVVSAVFFCCYGTIDATSQFDRAELYSDVDAEFDVILPTEGLLIQFHVVYFAISLFWFILTCIQAKHYARTRFVILIALTTIGFLATGFSQVLCVIKHWLGNSGLPTMIYSVTHMVVAAFTLFFFHSDDEVLYKQICDADTIGGESIADRISSEDERELGFFEDQDP